MKKLLLFLVPIALVSCEKEGFAPSTDNSTVSASGQRQTGNLRVFFDNGGPTEGTDYGCKGSGGNCLDDVVVSPAIAGAVHSFFGALHSGNPIAISNVVNNHRDDLLTFMDIEDVDGLSNGTFTARTRGTNPNKTRYIIMTDNTGKDVQVYPIKKP